MMRALMMGCLTLLSPGVFAQSLPLVPPPTRHRETGEDVLTLHDGTVLRGDVTILKPGDHVEIVLLDGRSQNIPWSDVASSAGPSFPAAATPRYAEHYLHPSAGRVPLVIDSIGRALTVGVLTLHPIIGEDTVSVSDGLTLDQSTTDVQSRSGTVVCTSTPCQIFAPPGRLILQTSGVGVLGSTTELTVPPTGGRVLLRAPMVRDQQIGRSLASASLTVILSGALSAIFGAAYSDPFFGNLGDVFFGVAGALAGVGVGLGIAAIVYLVRSNDGIVSIQPGARF